MTYITIIIIIFAALDPFNIIKMWKNGLQNV